MSIHIAEWDLPKAGIRIEISNPNEFLKRVKEINREQHVRRPTRVRVIGSDRVPAEIQRLVDKTDSPIESGSTDAMEHLDNQPKTEDSDPLAGVVQEDNSVKLDALAPANPEYAKKHVEEVIEQQRQKPKRKVVRARPGGSL